MVDVMRTLIIQTTQCSLRISLFNTPTADAIWQALPIESTAQAWGDEIYFNTGLSIAEEADAREVMQLGEVAYWPPGQAIALCFGPTPVSRNKNEMRLASAGNVWGTCLDDITVLSQVPVGTVIKVLSAA